MTVHIFAVSLVLMMATACAGTQSEKEVTGVENRASLSEDDRKNPLPGPVPTSPQDESQPAQLGALEVFELQQGESYRTISGTEVHLLGLTQIGVAHEISLTFSRGEDDVVQVTYKGRPLYLEGVVFETLYTITDEGGRVMATLRKDKSLTPINIAAAGEIAVNNFRERPECQAATQMGSRGERNGTVVVMALLDEEILCTATVGLYTARIIE